MSKGTVIFSNAGVVHSSTGGMEQYANGFTVNQDITLSAIEAKISNGKPYSENVSIALWDDTGKMISISTKSIPQGTTHSWISFGLTPIKLLAEREYVVGIIALGLGAILSNDRSLPETIKSNTKGFDFTVTNSRRRYSYTYTPAPPVYGYRDVFDFKLIWDMNSVPTINLTANNQPLTENQCINIGTNDFTVNITANDADPDDTLQYQVKLNNVVKQAWTTIAKNQPVSYTFKNADITAGVIPFTVSVRDDKGNQTDFNAELTKGKIGKDAHGRTTYTFEYTGKPEVFMVPQYATKIKFECWGAEGGTYADLKGGKGGYASGEYNPSSTSTFYIFVGGRGKTLNSLPVEGGFNGGGGGRSGSGGGASDVRLNNLSFWSRLIVAGGGGGAGPGGDGGVGGGLVGGDAENRRGNGGKGGTQTAGGTYNGVYGLGGDSRDAAALSGGGGGGYWGGGAGSYQSGGSNDGGGGGSSYYGNLANGSTTAGVRSGDGLVVITLLNEPPKCTLTSPPNNQTLTENATLNIQGT
ncbi:glycine rich domain-containing protein, partial [Brevibacillus laterosporus]|uniref:glycine rich domain-containing protein n=1 Tax=Brevibacillus laterosporus TaxID=1465 RepID=UPI000A44BD41